MARTGWGSSNYLQYAGAPVSALPLTISAWVRPASGAADQTIAGIVATGDRGGNCLILGATGLVFRAGSVTAASSGAADATASMTANVWAHGCAVFTSATSRACFLNGANKGTSATNLNGSMQRTVVGKWNSGGTPTVPPANSGTSIAHVAFWNIALSDADVARLAVAHPYMVRPDALVSYFPVWGDSAPETNPLSNAHVLTLNGSLSKTDGPRFIMPH